MQKKIHCTLAALACLILITGRGIGQQRLQRIEGEAYGSEFGTSLAPIGDLNQDRITDFAVGAPGADHGGVDSGAVYLISGRTGLSLERIDGYEAHLRFGGAVANAGDFNRDGAVDLIVGATGSEGFDQGTTGAMVLSGWDGSELWFLTDPDPVPGSRFGFAVDGAGDVNGDGYADIIVGAPGFGDGTGRAYVYSGFDRTRLWAFEGAAEGFELGYSVSHAGDANRDGYGDVLVGIPGARNNGRELGCYLVFSGRNGEILREEFGVVEGGRFGASVDSLGDVNGDGLPEVLVGSGGGGEGPSAVRVHGGRAATPLLWEHLGRDPDDRLGYRVAVLGDVDGDQVPDYALAGQAGYLEVHSGIDGATLTTLYGRDNEPGFGRQVAAAGDLDRDGLPDLLVADPGLKGRGAVWKFAALDPLEMTAPVPGWAGELNHLRVVSGRPGERLALILGTEAGETRVGGCAQIRLALVPPLWRVATLRTNPQGVAKMGHWVPSSAAGRSLQYQALSLDTCRTSSLLTHRYRTAP